MQIWSYSNAIFYSLPGFGDNFAYISLCLRRRKRLWGYVPRSRVTVRSQVLSVEEVGKPTQLLMHPF